MNTTDTTRITDTVLLAALDAFLANDPRAAKLLVDCACPVTVSIGSDSYPGHVTKVSASLKTITVVYGTMRKEKTFRLTSGGSYTSGRHYYLTLGEARRSMEGRAMDVNPCIHCGDPVDGGGLHYWTETKSCIGFRDGAYVELSTTAETE